MRTTAFAIALMMGGAAVAQTSTTTKPVADIEVGAEMEEQATTHDGTMDHGTNHGTMKQGAMDHGTSHGTMTHGTAKQPVGDIEVGAQEEQGAPATTYGTTSYSKSGTLMAASSQKIQPSNASPERDARGIAVLSDPAFVPVGWNGITGAAMGGPLEEPANGYPACSATVTDNCVQAYEGGR